MKAPIQFFDRLMQRWTPDPFVIAVLMTALSVLLAKTLTPSSWDGVVLAWGDGFWKLSTFTLQMAMILLGGYLVASSPVMKKLLQLICQKIQNPTAAIVATTLVSAFACLFNWGFGLVIGAFLAVEMARAVPGVSYRALIASSYSGFLLWHAGLSGSIPLVVNTEDNFSMEWIGRIITLDETIFSTFNITAVLGLLILLPLLNVWLSRHLDQDVLDLKPPLMPEVTTPQIKESTPAQKIEKSLVLPLMLGFFGLFYIFLVIRNGAFRLDLDTMNFAFIILAILLHGSSTSFLSALNEGAQKVGPILLQYPIYAGIMGIMRETGLANVISDFFVNVSSPQTYPLFTFWSAGLVNLFIPSGGGQWAVQAPIVIPGAEALGSDIPLVVMAVAWGDSWTNMAQPFWAIPLLALAGLGAKDILGFTLAALALSGAYLSFLFLIFA